MAMEERRLLESWKEISAYLKRSERTCLRWEETLGLPIHRLDGTPSARVFAYADELDHWLQEKLNHVEAETKQTAVSRGRRKRGLLLAAFAFASLAISIILIWHPFSPAPDPLLPRNPSIAILPFENPTKDTGLEPWRTALADLLVTDLFQSRYVNVARIGVLNRKLIELKLGEADRFPEETVRTVAEKAEVDYVTTGSLVREGQDVVITILLHDPKTGEGAKALRASYRDETDIFSVADELTKKIKLGINLTPRHVSRDIDRSVAAISTASPQAFGLFSQGYRLSSVLKNQESIALFQRAVELDPEFALAHKFLSLLIQNAGRADEARKCAQKAFTLARRLSERDRDEFEYNYYYGEYDKNRSKQTEALKRWFRYYPQDTVASSSLMALYMGLEDWDRALGVAQAARGANKSNGVICQQLSKCYLNLGWGEKAIGVLSEFIESNPGKSYLTYVKLFRARCYLQLGKLGEALAEVERLIAQEPDSPGPILLKGTIHIHREDFPAAAAEFRKVLERDDPYYQTEALLLSRDMCLMQGRVEEAKDLLRRGLEIAEKVDSKRVPMIFSRKESLHQELSYLHRLAGRPDEALKEIDEALRSYKELDDNIPPVSLLHQKALVLLDLDRMEDFTRLTEEIKGLIEREEKPKLMRIYYHLLGSRELKKNNPKKAVDHFWKAIDLLSVPGSDLDGADPEYYFSLAEAYARAGSGPAISMYEQVTLPAVARVHYGDMYAISLYRMAKSLDEDAGATIFREMSNISRARAAENYRQFLALWGGADPMFAPLVEDARKRLAVLESR
jgi:tetratricopeptide (TPR) repeat protein